MTGRPTTTTDHTVATSVSKNSLQSELLTKNALRTHCDGLDDVAPRAAARVEQDSKFALSQGLRVYT